MTRFAALCATLSLVVFLGCSSDQEQSSKETDTTVTETVDTTTTATTDVDSLVPPPVPEAPANDRWAEVLRDTPAERSVRPRFDRTKRVLATCKVEGLPTIIPIAMYADGAFYNTVPFSGEVLIAHPRYLAYPQTGSPKVLTVQRLPTNAGGREGRGPVTDLSLEDERPLEAGGRGPFCLSVSSDSTLVSHSGLLGADTTLSSTQRTAIAEYLAEQNEDVEPDRIAALLGTDPPSDDSLAVDVTSWDEEGDGQTEYLVAVEWFDTVRFQLEGAVRTEEGKTDTVSKTAERTTLHLGRFEDGRWKNVYSRVEAHPGSPPREADADETLQVLDVTGDGGPEILSVEVVSGYESAETTFSVLVYKEGTFKTVFSFSGRTVAFR